MASFAQVPPPLPGSPTARLTCSLSFDPQQKYPLDRFLTPCNYPHMKHGKCLWRKCDFGPGSPYRRPEVDARNVFPRVACRCAGILFPRTGGHRPGFCDPMPAGNSKPTATKRHPGIVPSPFYLSHNSDRLVTASS